MEGLRFDRGKTAKAVAAKSTDLAAARTRIAEKMTAAAKQMPDAINQPYTVYSFGEHDNTYTEHTLDRASVECVATS